jgi:hypothetical protein
MMPCAGCLRRRKKIAAAITAVKRGLAVAKQSYNRETTDHTPKRASKNIPHGIRVIDIRQ